LPSAFYKSAGLCIGVSSITQFYIRTEDTGKKDLE